MRTKWTIERQLVERAQRGDRAAFGELYERYADDVYAYVLMQVRDSNVALELTQEAFISAMRGIGRFRWQGSFAPWLLRIAHNQVANFWRSRSREPSLVRLPADDAAEDALPELAMEQSTLDEFVLDVSPGQLTQAYGQLSVPQRQVIALRFGAGLSLLETAEAMGRTVGAVKNLQYKALGALRRHLEPWEARA